MATPPLFMSDPLSELPPPIEKPSAAPAHRTKRIFIGWWVAVAVVSVHLGLYVSAILSLMWSASASKTAFSQLAIEHHQAFLLRTNVELLRGYAVVCVGYWLVITPLIRWWLLGRPSIGRWSVLWRSTALTLLGTGYFFLRLIEVRPYFLTQDAYNHWFFQVLSGLPDGTRHRVFFVLFSVIPSAVVFTVAVYWGSRLLLRLIRGWPQSRARIASFATCSVLVGGWMLAPVLAPTGITPVLNRPRPTQPNVLILASDSLRADRLSCNGYPRATTPHIDRLASKSVNFSKMMTPIASTLESMTTAMTGQYPHTHGIQHMYPSRWMVDRMLSHSPKLAEHFANAGYKTSVMGDWCAGIFHVVPLGFQKIEASDFDDFRLYIAQTVYMAHWMVPLYFDNDFGYWLFPRLPSFASYVTPEVVTERLCDRLDHETESDRPFFLTAFYSCTHIPYYCPPQYSSRYTDPKYSGPNKYKMDFNVDSFVKGTGLNEKFSKLPPEEIQQIRSLYDGCVSFFDDQVGQVIERLERNGQLDNTIVVVMADHGDDLFEPGTTLSHGVSFNGGDQTNNLPFVLYVPQKTGQARSIGRVVRTVDIAPTLLDLAGLPAESRFEGVSLRPYCEQPAADLSLAFYGETSYLFFNRQMPNGEKPLHFRPLEETTAPDPAFDYHFVLKDTYQDYVLRAKERCVRTERWKLIFTPGEERDIWRLFYLPNDPHCEKDVKLAHPEVWQAMEKALRQWVDQRKEMRIADIFPEGEPRIETPGT